MKKSTFELGDLDRSSLTTSHQLGERWNKSQRTLQRWRSEGYGPAHILIGGTVHYQVGDILDFEARQRRGGKA